MSVTEKDFSKLSERVKKVEDNIESIKKDISIQQQQFENTIKTQEEIIVDMINRFNDEFLKHKTRITTDLEEVKSQQDVLRISYTINESQMTNKIKELTSNEIKKAIKRGMIKNPQWKLSCMTSKNEKIAVEWWLSGKTMNEYFI